MGQGHQESGFKLRTLLNMHVLDSLVLGKGLLCSL
jgi:hypothetical protein